MHIIPDKYLHRCPRTGTLIRFKMPKGGSVLLLPAIGCAALLWIVWRVATKPSRITYPCVRAAVPFASSFLGYLVFLGLSLFVWAKARKHMAVPVLVVVSAFALIGICGSYIFADNGEIFGRPGYVSAVQAANQPIGRAVGIFPGRVVWVHRADATNENCSPKAVGHEWYRPENNNQSVIDSMVSAAIRELTGTTSDAAAWDAIFRFHNATRGKGSVGYVAGEKFFIKTNATSSWSGNFNAADLTPLTSSSYYGVSETSPEIVLAVLRQLVHVVGVAPADISVGDPMKHIYKHCYDLWQAEFPAAHYLDVSGYENLGRERVVKSTTATISYSDRGTVLRSNGSTGTPIVGDTLYTVYETAEYMLNIPMLKGHLRAGATMFAKNHFGSNSRGGASHLHNGLVAPEGENPPVRQGYGLYRVQVDLLGHRLLGRKNLFYLMDALWATDYELDVPLKWRMPPFNNDWTSSVFASFDPVAIESVGYDFLRSEFTAQRGASTCVQMNGVDDYLHQAADSTTWPAGITYDPEHDGILLASLGTHEHWNDSTNKQYSRDLHTGGGIELRKLEGTVTANEGSEYLPPGFVLEQNYPNPFNPATTIAFVLSARSRVSLAIFDIAGREVAVLASGELPAGKHLRQWRADGMASGVYFCRLRTSQASGAQGTDRTETKKLLLVK